MSNPRRGPMDYPDHKVGYAIFDRTGKLCLRGSFQLDDYDSRRAFAIRANEATMAGQEVRTWNYRDDPERYAIAPPPKEERITGPDEYGSVYVYFQQPVGNVFRTCQHRGMVQVDYDFRGKLFGIEILDVKKEVEL